MSNQLIIGIIINILAFGAMAFSDPKLGVLHLVPQPLRHFKLLDAITTTVYFGSFLIILLAPGNLIVEIAICLVLQFFINHVLWGTITGFLSKRKRNSAASMPHQTEL